MKKIFTKNQNTGNKIMSLRNFDLNKKKLGMTKRIDKYTLMRIDLSIFPCSSFLSGF